MKGGHRLVVKLEQLEQLQAENAKLKLIVGTMEAEFDQAIACAAAELRGLRRSLRRNLERVRELEAEVVES
jgi:hypothetical protein